MDAPKLQRGLFGYSRKSVRLVLTDRDVMVVRAIEDARAAEEKLAEVTPELERARRENGELAARIRDLDARLRDSAERFRAVERSGSPSTTEGLTDVLHAAERALARLTDAARRNAEHELGETERVHGELRAEIDRLAAWRARMVPLTDAVVRSIEEARATTATLAGRLSELAETSAPAVAEPEEVEREVIRLEEAGAGAEEPVPPAPEATIGPWARDGNRRSDTA